MAAAAGTHRAPGGDDYYGGTARLIMGYAAAVERGDIDTPALQDLVALEQVIDDAKRAAVLSMRARGYNWQTIADALGMTKAGARNRYAGRDGSLDPVGALGQGRPAL